MSLQMVIMWTCGDVFKTSYFYLRNTPAQFFICGAMQVIFLYKFENVFIFFKLCSLYFQVTVDLCILAQVWIYRSLDLELSDLTLFLVNRENTEKRKRSERLAL